MTIFMITSALNAPNGAKFSPEERLEQTIQTLDSIPAYFGKAQKFVFDSSAEVPSNNAIERILRHDGIFYYTGKDPRVKHYSGLLGGNSIAESFSLIDFLDWLGDRAEGHERIYKISGRYQLSNRFVPHEEHKDSFVFAQALNSWMPEPYQKAAKVDKLYRSRLWSMDANLLPTFKSELPNIAADCERGLDMEHSFYKHLNKYKVVELPVIGVTGHTGISGEFIDE